MGEPEGASTSSTLRGRAGAGIDLALTLPIFIGYHLGVVFLNVRNGTDLMTEALLRLAEGNRPLYLLYTAAIGVVFAGVFAWLGRGEAFRIQRFAFVIVEGAFYAMVMRMTASYVVTRMFFAGQGLDRADPFVGTIMSFGAGFYEELTFRVVLFGLGAKAAVWLATRESLHLLRGSGRLSAQGFFVAVGWSLVAAAVFSGVHYVGNLGDPFDLVSFTFRWVLGLTLTLVYVLRGFATAVWSHALYDVGVLVF